jgi:hypothetical protein
MIKLNQRMQFKGRSPVNRGSIRSGGEAFAVRVDPRFCFFINWE